MANAIFSKRLWFYSSSLILAVILFWGISRGLGKGKDISQSEIVLQNAIEIKKSLKFFYDDQNRYPTANEFADKNIMASYMVNFPPQDFISANCEKSFEYKRPDSQSYQLNFCLPASVDNYQKGWNRIIEQD